MRSEIAQTGGMTSSIFPLVEQWLEDTDHQRALEYVACRKNMSRYESVVDFIIVEMNPQLRAPCCRFYEERGPALREIITQAERDRLEQRAMRLLGVAYEAMSEHRRLSWSATVSVVERLAA